MNFQPATPEYKAFDFKLIKGPILGKSQIEQAEKQLKDVNDGTISAFELVDVTGKKLSVLVQKGRKYEMCFQGIFEVTNNDPNMVEYPFRRCAIHLAPEHYSEFEDNNMELVELKIKTWEKTWECSQQKKLLEECLRKHAKDMREVTNVIGLGLGRPGGEMKFNKFRESKPARERSFYQHKALCEISRILSEEQDHAVSTFAQDPFYSETSKTIFNTYFSEIQILENPHGFLKATRSSFVITFFPGAPVPHIIMGAVGHDGPAGMFTTRWGGDMEKEWAGKTVKEHFPRGYKFWASTSMCEWRNKCTKVSFPDPEWWFGSKTQSAVLLLMGKAS